MTHCAHSVRGNHDHGVAQGLDVQGDHGYRYLTRVTRPLMWGALDSEERRYLLQLPLMKKFTIGGKRFLLVHGTPRDPLDEYVMRDADAWAKRLEAVEADIVIVGHTHMQFCLSIGDKMVLNPGSVGQPRDGDPRAAYAVIDGPKILLKRIEYPVDETIAKFESLDVPDKAKEMFQDSLRRGKMTLPRPVALPVAAAAES